MIRHHPGRVRHWLERGLVAAFGAGYLLQMVWLRNGALSLFVLLVVPHELKAARGERFMPSPVLTAVWCTVLVLFAVAVLSDIGRWVEVALLIVIWILVAVSIVSQERGAAAMRGARMGNDVDMKPVPPQ